MKLSEIKNGNLSAEWAEKGYELPKFDVEAVKAKTHAEPTWVHFGAGNIFRAFPAAILNDALNSGKYDRGVIVAESFDYEIIDKAYQPYDNLSLLVCLWEEGPGSCRPGYGKYDRALGIQYMLGVWDLLDRLDEEKKKG